MVCSIVIPVFNKAGLTRRCLDSILANPPALSHEIIVVDDASSDSTPELLEGYGDRVRVVRLKSNAGFATACNTGAAASDQPEYLLFLNNDTLVHERWLDALVAYAEAHPNASVVGSKLLFPDGTIQHAGVAFNLYGDPLHIYVGCAADHPAVNKPRRFQAVTAASLLIRREAFEQVGGFDTGYHNDLEDVDLCLKLGEIGHEVHYCPDSVVVHFESASRGTTEGAGPSADVYRAKWAARVRHDELDYYLEDGMLEILRTHPERIKAGKSGRRRDAELLQVRLRQFLGLLREGVRMTTHATDPASFDPEGIGRRRNGSSRRGSRAVPLRVRRKIEHRLRSLRGSLESAIGAGGEDGGATHQTPEEEPKKAAYEGYSRLQAEVHAAVRDNVPRGRSVLVVSRGDEQFVRLEGHRGWHFPRHEDGRWGGYYPEDSEGAIAHLEDLRAKGAQYLVFPETALWWLEYYGDFREHLEACYRIVNRSESCLIYDVSRRSGAIPARKASSDTAEVKGSDSVSADTGTDSGSKTSTPMPETEYAELIDRIRELVAETLPDASTVLVVSRGDKELLDLGAAHGWHFPRGDDGDYLGYYPKDDDEAISHLEQQRANGAQYLVFPSSAFWWMDHYRAFAVHLRNLYPTVHRADECEIFDLLVRPVGDVVERLLPAGARLAVVSGGPGLAGLDPERAIEFEPGPDADSAAAELWKLLAQGVEFLVIPRSAFGWLDEHPTFRQFLLRRHRFVTRQEHFCEIYELSQDLVGEAEGGLPAKDHQASQDMHAGGSIQTTSRVREALGGLLGRRRSTG